MPSEKLNRSRCPEGRDLSATAGLRAQLPTYDGAVDTLPSNAATVARDARSAAVRKAGKPRRRTTGRIVAERFQQTQTVTWGSRASNGSLEGRASGTVLELIERRETAEWRRKVDADSWGWKARQ